MLFTANLRLLAASMCYPMHVSSLTSVSNLVDLADLNEASVLHNLRSRYNNGDIFAGVQCDTQMFTYIGVLTSVLCAN